MVLKLAYFADGTARPKSLRRMASFRPSLHYVDPGAAQGHEPGKQQAGGPGPEDERVGAHDRADPVQ